VLQSQDIFWSHWPVDWFCQVIRMLKVGALGIWTFFLIMCTRKIRVSKEREVGKNIIAAAPRFLPKLSKPRTNPTEFCFSHPSLAGINIQCLPGSWNSLAVRLDQNNLCFCSARLMIASCCGPGGARPDIHWRRRYIIDDFRARHSRGCAFGRQYQCQWFDAQHEILMSIG